MEIIIREGDYWKWWQKLHKDQGNVDSRSPVGGFSWRGVIPGWRWNNGDLFSVQSPWNSENWTDTPLPQINNWTKFSWPIATVEKWLLWAPGTCQLNKGPVPPYNTQGILTTLRKPHLLDFHLPCFVIRQLRLAQAEATWFFWESCKAGSRAWRLSRGSKNENRIISGIMSF